MGMMYALVFLGDIIDHSVFLYVYVESEIMRGVGFKFTFQQRLREERSSPRLCPDPSKHVLLTAHGVLVHYRRLEYLHSRRTEI